ncbi:MAG TPA: ATP-grasp fold amidoligase family protein [Gemmatimonadales bacterium]|nr:ATP-grasp fold amidoligase family protein [Gemmatimonadales bacterium]
MIDSSKLIQKSSRFTKKWMKKVIAPSTLIAQVSKVIPISERWYLSWRYFLTFGRTLDLANPRSFTAKLQWLKLYGRPQEYAPLADKFAVYDYVRARIGDTHLNRLLGVYQHLSEIPWDGLPNKFVLKATHASGWNLIVADKTQLDRQKAVELCRRWLTTSYAARSREPVYERIPPRIICVEYLGDPDSELFDYKLYCFNGKVRLIHVDTERFSGHQRTFYTPEWERLPFAYTYPTRDEGVARPAALEEMISLAERLAGTIPFVRVDFFYIHNQVIFGEMTFFPDAGFGIFTPPEWDEIIGSYLELPRS